MWLCPVAPNHSTAMYDIHHEV